MTSTDFQVQSRVEQFENIYGMSFQNFEVNVLPTLNTWEAHDGYNDWCFWRTLSDRKFEFLAEHANQSFKN